MSDIIDIEAVSLVECPKCGTTNRVRPHAPKVRPVCSVCRAVLKERAAPGVRRPLPDRRFVVASVASAVAVAVLVFIALWQRDPAPNVLVSSQPPPLVQREVPHGRVLKNAVKEGRGAFRVKNGTKDSAVIKVVDSFRNTSVYAEVVGPGAETEIRGLPDGAYRVIFAFGTGWYVDSDQFAEVHGSAEFKELFHFRTHRQADGTTIGDTVSLTLALAAGGTVKTGRISPQEFSKY